jgi:hypothetical protein
MIEKAMNVSALPAFLIAMFKTDRVRVRKTGSVLLIEPMTEVTRGKKYSCPFLGTVKGGSLTVDKFLEMKREERKLELDNEKRLFS